MNKKGLLLNFKISTRSRDIQGIMYLKFTLFRFPTWLLILYFLLKLNRRSTYFLLMNNFHYHNLYDIFMSEKVDFRWVNEKQNCMRSNYLWYKQKTVYCFKIWKDNLQWLKKKKNNEKREKVNVCKRFLHFNVHSHRHLRECT